MKKQTMHLLLGALLAVALAAASAQTAVPDPALQAKASAGDATAQIALGEQLAASAAAEHSALRAGETYQQAADWYRKAAAQGSIPGEMHLASLYRDGGKGFNRDLAQAFAWYRKAAEQGDATAQGTLGVLYSFGQGIAQNYAEAYFWLDLAASASSPDQQKYASNRQLIGTHLTTDEVDAAEERVSQWKAAHAKR
jgi:hypothetical protein